MRTARPHGPCAECGADEPGCYWHTVYKVIDYGTPAIPPQEPAMMTPIRCDGCELDWRRINEEGYPG